MHCVTIHASTLARCAELRVQGSAVCPLTPSPPPRPPARPGRYEGTLVLGCTARTLDAREEGLGEAPWAHISGEPARQARRAAPYMSSAAITMGKGGVEQPYGLQQTSNGCTFWRRHAAKVRAHGKVPLHAACCCAAAAPSSRRADADLQQVAESLVGEVAVLPPRYRLQRLPGMEGKRVEEDGGCPL